MLASREHEPGLPDAFVPQGRETGLYEGVPYEQYWQTPARARQDALERYLIAEMLPARGRRIVDVGCGYGRLASCYLDRFDEVVLYDGSMSLLRQAQAALGSRATLVAGDITRIPFRPATFDTVLSIRVLQHVHNLEAVLTAMCRILSRDGQLLFSYHNKRNVRRMVRYVVSPRIASPFDEESAEVSPALLSHHPKRVGAILAQAGFLPPEYRGAMVVGALARITERPGHATPSGAGWSAFAGRHWLAPWLIGRALPRYGESLVQAASVDELLMCPACRESLHHAGDEFTCMGCKKSYAIREGIIDLRESRDES